MPLTEKKSSTKGKRHHNGLGEAEMPEGYPSRDDRPTVGYLDLPLWGQAKVGAHIRPTAFRWLPNLLGERALKQRRDTGIETLEK